MTTFKRLQPRYHWMAKKHYLLPIMSGIVNTTLSARLGSMQLFMYANSGHPRSPCDSVLRGPLCVVELTELSGLLGGDSKNLRLWSLSIKPHVIIFRISLISATLPTPLKVSFKSRVLDLANLLPKVYTTMPPSVSYALINQNEDVLERWQQGPRD